MKRLGAITSGTLALSLAAAAAAAPETSAPPKAPPVAAATAADIKAGAPLRDSEGAPVGTLVSATDTSAVVDTGQTKIGVPLTFFKKDDKGVLLSITAKQFSDAVAKAHARSQAQQQQQPAQAQQPH